MITWLTLYLGLIAGSRTFDLAVADNTARVDVLLDGQVVAELTAPPWSVTLDLGSELLPHELVAVGYDGEGHHLGRARQLINLPSPPVALGIALEYAGGRPSAARLVWETVGELELSDVRVALDGRELPVEDPLHIPLPPLDLELVHHLAAEIAFSRQYRGQTAVVFGGAYADQVDSDLTAMPVEWRGGGPVPKPDAAVMNGWFERRGRPVPVFAVERPPADLVVVRDRASGERLARFAGSPMLPRLAGEMVQTRMSRETMQRRVQELGVGLREGDWLRIIATTPERPEGSGKAYFRASPNLLPITEGLGWTVARVAVRDLESPERITDAVAAAGLESAGSGRRRMVLLVLDPSTEDAGSHTIDSVLAYLRAVRVPFTLWTAGKAEDLPRTWGEATEVKSRKRMREAVDDLAVQLDRQLVVWLEGSLLPQEVTLTAEGARHLRLPSPLGG